MITMTITMNARAEKRRELLQTLSGLLPFLSKEPGCHDAQVYMDLEDANHLMLVEMWDTQQDADRYMQSHYFAVLCGAMQLLTTSSDITFSPTPQTTQIKPILMGQCRECGNIDECRVSVCA